jgi:membrane-associated phospholipid phosphatase
VVWLYKSGRVDGFYLPDRRQRLRPLIAIWLGNVLAFVPMLFIGAPFGLMVFVGFGALQSGLYLLVSLFWKISGHTTAITGLSVALFALFGWPAAPALVMIPLVSWARVRLNNHDLGQTIGGVVLGFCFVTGTLMVINYYCGGIGLSCG